MKIFNTRPPVIPSADFGMEKNRCSSTTTCPSPPFALTSLTMFLSHKFMKAVLVDVIFFGKCNSTTRLTSLVINLVHFAWSQRWWNCRKTCWESNVQQLQGRRPARRVADVDHRKVQTNACTSQKVDSYLLISKANISCSHIYIPVCVMATK